MAIVGILVFVVFVYYVLEVLLGFSLSGYHGEIGFQVISEEKKKLSHAEFFGRLIPLALISAGFPLLVAFPAVGFLMLLAAFLLFFVVFK